MERRAGQTLGLCWGSVAGGGLLDVARVAAANGLHAISITPGQVFDLLESGMAAMEIRRRLADLGVKVTSVDPLIQPLPAIPSADEVDERFRPLLTYDCDMCWRAAEAVTAETINMVHFLGGPAEISHMQEIVAEAAEQSFRRGFTTTFEFLPGTAIPDLAAAAKLIEASPHLRIMFDTWHFARSGGVPGDIDQLAPGVIGSVQLNDWAPPVPGAPYVPMSGRLIPGQGGLPLRDILARIERNSPGLVVSIEVFSRALEEISWEDGVRLLTEASEPLLAPAV